MDFAREGTRKAERIAIIDITTNNSIRVKPLFLLYFLKFYILSPPPIFYFI